MDTITEMTHPEVPASSLYLSCLDMAIRSFNENITATASSAITARADEFFNALKATTS